MAKNTVEKGDAFENKVYTVFKTLLEKDELPISSKRSLVHQKKKYYSKVREDYICFDITIESFLPNETEYSSLWIIECKDYEQSIPVNRIQTFKAQIDEVAGHKGIFVSTNKYQKGAITTAKSYGIGLAIMQPNESLYWQVKRLDSVYRSYDNTELEEIFYDVECKINESFIATIKNKVFTNIIDYLSYEGLVTIAQTKVSAPYLTIEKIEEIALNCFGKLGVKQYFKISSKEIISILKNRFGIEVISSTELVDRELGRLDLNKNIIYLSSNLEIDSPRWRFTLAHELGHVILHKTLLMRNGISLAIEWDSDDSFLYNSTILADKNIKRIEIQANIFASYVLLPNYPMALKLTNFMNQIGHELNKYNNRYIYYDDNPKNRLICNKIFAYIGKSFDVSMTVVKYRLIELNLLIDNSRTKDIFSVFKSIREEVKSK